jgi:ADP-ribose pyrophosphatase
METWITKREIHKGRIFSLWGGEALLDNGDRAVREYVRHPGGVAIVPVVDDNVILIQQFRIAVEREVIELPAGLLEPGEQPVQCAARELEEELGYRADHLIPLASYFSSVGFSDERMHVFLAMQPAKTMLKRDPEERLREIFLPTDMIAEKLAAGAFEDAKTIVGLREFLAYQQREKNN